MKTQLAKRNLRRRNASFGAIMAEAAIVMPVLTAFFGMMTYDYKVISTRINADSAARANVSDTASHNCEGGSNGASIMQMGLGIVDQATSAAGSKHGDQGSAEILGNMVQSAGQTIMATANTKFGDRTVTAGAKMTCNEKPFDGNISTWFKYAASAFTGTGGNFP